MNLFLFTSNAQTTQLVVSTTTTTDASDYQWEILDSDSASVLFSSSAFSDNTMVNDTITLNDCSNYYFVTSSNDTANTSWSSGSSVYVIDLESSDTLIKTVGFTPPFINALFSSDCNLMINEIHYDNIGADTLEGVEVVGKAGYDLSCYSIYLYDGANGLLYDSLNLSGIIPNDSCGYGAVWFPISGIQNGSISSGDGIALANSCTNYKVQFLSYEGSFVANNGFFASDTAVDIGVIETSMTLVNTSLQLIGFGEEYSSFNWTSLPSSRNSVNTWQSFCLPDLELVDVVLDSVCENLTPVFNRFIITNVGQVPFIDFWVNYSINGGPTISESVSVDLMPLDTLHYTFTVFEDFSNAAGDYTITSWCTLDRDSNSSNDSLIQTINFIDISVSDLNVCYGDTLLLSPTISNATNYVWNTGDTTSSISFIAASSTSYTIKASNTCYTDSATINVNVTSPLDLGSDITICEGDYHTFFIFDDYELYQWSQGGSFNYIMVNNPGDYWLKVTTSMGCSMTDTVTLITKNCTSLEDVDNVQSPKIFPNPNNGVFNLSFDDFSQNEVNIEIVSALGEKVYVQELEFLNGSISHVFELNTLPKGIYFLHVISENKRIFERLVIQ